MKKVIKRLMHFINEDCLNLYLKYFYRWQLKHKLLKINDSIDNTYKEEIQNYWDQFNLKISTDWHKFYSSRNGLRDVRYIPEDLFYCVIEPFYNRVDFKEAYADKALYSIWFANVKRPVTIAKNMSGTIYDDDFRTITLEEVLTRCENKSRIIIKPTIDSGAGKNIVFINADSADEMREKTNKVLADFEKDYVIQEILEQHDSLKQLNPSSVNTIRMTTFLHNNEVSILTSHIRIGTDNSNYDHNGIVCGIKEGGNLQDFACKYKKGDVFAKHPQGYEFKNVTIPGFEDMKTIAKREHLKFGHFRLISWDFAVEKDGCPVLIEVNLRWQGLNHHQLTIGPLFGDLTDEVLEEVFGRR